LEKSETVRKWYEIYTNCQKRYKWKKKWKAHYINVDWEFEERVWSKLIVANLEAHTEGLELTFFLVNLALFRNLVTQPDVK
jgi:hypothetical protein